ncbi:F-box and WD repeat domain containing protein 10B isoform X1 [Astyanax mexicanus]|uniref:F-box and WD repeat domain containing protein 10B isoform X1 n=1 Tax=Astyanax mexicanus TaxID=7994 RepID=UPI0020CB0E9B|nr:F-box and WD repeat domain containing protein 10B isoform X1 [Astyanax mexicanus]
MQTDTIERRQRAEDTQTDSTERRPQFSCRTERRQSACGRCQSCAYSTHLQHSTQWLNRAGDEAKRRFLTGLLLRCRSLKILENLQNVLQITSGKDFTYSRAQIKAQLPVEGRNWECGDNGDSGNLCGMSMMETWDWFIRSPDWIKCSYLLRLFSLCHFELLHRLGNLVGVLIAREKRGFLHFNTAENDEDQGSVSGSIYSFHTDDHPELDLLVQASSVYEPVSFPHQTQHNSAVEILDKPQPTKNSIWSKQEEIAYIAQKRQDSDTDSNSSEDPALMVVPGSSKSMSGVSLHRDFIGGLPVDISKRILGLLDKATLQHCKRVSQHWCYLTEEVLGEMEVKKMVEKQAMNLQGSSTSGVNPVYARIRKVLVPLGEEEDDTHPIKTGPSSIKEVGCLESVYTGVKTKAVELEERNVFCGDFNILILLDREDPSRVIHYSGGQMVAVGSKDRAVRLLDVTQIKEVPLLMQGHAGSVRAVLICEERGLIISASYDLSIRCWNLKTGECTMLLSGHMGTITCLDLHEDLLVSGARDCRVKVWSLQSGQCYEKLKMGHRKPVLCVKISASLVLSSCEEGLVKVWETETADLLKIITGHQGYVKCLFFDQWHILSGGADGQVLAWSTKTHFTNSLMTFHHPKEVLTLSFLFLRVITGCLDGKIRIFNFLSGDCLRIIKISTHQSPVLSIHTHDNRIVVNSSSRVLLLQFTEQRWDYSAGPKRRSWAALHPPPHSNLHPEPKSSSGSSRPKIYNRDRRTGTQGFPQNTRSQSAPCRQKAHNIQEQIIRPATLSPNNRARITSSSTATSSEKSLATSKHVNETAVQEYLRKRGLHHPVTTTQVLLKVVRSTQEPHNCDLATSNMNLNAAVRDCWGPPASDPVMEIQTKTPPPPPPPLPPAKTHHRPHSAPKPSNQTSFKGTVKIYTTLRTHPLDLKLRHSLHSREVQSNIPSPTLIRPQTVHKPKLKPKPKRPQTVCGARTVSSFTTTAEEDVQNVHKVFMRSAVKHPGRHVDFEMPGNPRKSYIPLDPFRKHTNFQLKTDSELQELLQSHCTELHHTQNHTHTQNHKEKQRRTAWKLKIKGLPPNDYMKQGQVYAPELGEDIYI